MGQESPLKNNRGVKWCTDRQASMLDYTQNAPLEYACTPSGAFCASFSAPNILLSLLYAMLCQVKSVILLYFMQYNFIDTADLK